VTPDRLLYAAVDLGAGSGRVFLGNLSPDGPVLEQVTRFRYPPRISHGRLRWDFAFILDEVRRGLAAASSRAAALGGTIASLGIDSWGVDYGLVDDSGRLLEDPVCYRDDGIAGAMEKAFARVSREEIFARTGIQVLPINTLYQLCAHVERGLPAGAARLLMIPDLITSALTGCAATEFTNATTTQMLNTTTGTWERDLLDRLDLPSHFCADILHAGKSIGPVTPAAGAEIGVSGLPVVAVATHDTGSAVAGTPLQDGWAYISSGTWSLVGTELSQPLVNERVAALNFTNEGGAFGTTRFLRNVMGLWILESCRAEWQKTGVDADYGRLLEEVAALDGPRAVVFPDDPRLLHPASMIGALETQLRETGQTPPDRPAHLARVVLDSLALRYASIIGSIPVLTGQAIEGIRVVGGGSQNVYLNQATATTTGLRVVAGPIEATVLGNVLVQAIAAGRFSSLSDARHYVAAHSDRAEVLPRPTVDWREAAARYADIEGHFDRR
jgi:rhamnulokinase